MKVFCFTCGNDEAQVVATKGECNLVECTQCGCRWERSRALPGAEEASDKAWQRSADSEQGEADAGHRNRRRSLDPLYERTALVEVDFMDKSAEASTMEEKLPSLFEQRNVIY